MTDLVYNNEQFALMKGFGVREFGELLEKSMQREAEEKTKTSFAPSSLGYTGSCPRYWYYAFNGTTFEYENDGPSISNMDAGSDAGVRIAKLLKKADILVDDEVPVRHNDPPVFGFIDALVRWKGEVIPAEVKTTKAETWQWRASNNMVPGYQMLQLLIYMYLTDNVRGFFITENKNTNQLYILPVVMTDERRAYVESVFEWMRTVHKNALEGELPTRPFTKASMVCKGCPVKKICWSGYKRGSVNGTDPAPGVVDLPPLEVPKTL